MPPSTITKNAIASGLKDLMKRQSFDKITIADITEKCGLNRQTFYYHFQDKYELINWIYYHDYISKLSDGLTLENWYIKVQEMLIKMKNDSYFFENAFKSSGESEFERYLLSFTNDLFKELIQIVDEKNEVSSKDKDFIAQFYSFGSVGMIISWAKTGMDETAENIVTHIKNLVSGTRMMAGRI